jgi:hypothetical protein
MNAAEMLNGSFAAVGYEYGYDSVTAEFEEFKEFKVKWRRSCGWAEFEVSDYLTDAPQNVMTGLAETIFSRISGKARERYPSDMMQWITSDDFVKNKQPLYLQRARNLTGTPIGEHIDLEASYRRLVDLGLAEYDEDLVISWTRMPNTKRVGYCSVLMKVIMISSVFDTPSIPPFVSDYVLYHELIHMSKGFDPFGQRHGADFHVLERLYPMKDEADEWMKRLRLYI